MINNLCCEVLLFLIVDDSLKKQYSNKAITKYIENHKLKEIRIKVNCSVDIKKIRWYIICMLLEVHVTCQIIQFILKA